MVGGGWPATFRRLQSIYDIAFVCLVVIYSMLKLVDGSLASRLQRRRVFVLRCPGVLAACSTATGWAQSATPAGLSCLSWEVRFGAMAREMSVAKRRQETGAIHDTSSLMQYSSHPPRDNLRTVVNASLRSFTLPSPAFGMRRLAGGGKGFDFYRAALGKKTAVFFSFVLWFVYTHFGPPSLSSVFFFTFPSFSVSGPRPPTRL